MAGLAVANRPLKFFPIFVRFFELLGDFKVREDELGIVQILARGVDAGRVRFGNLVFGQCRRCEGDVHVTRGLSAIDGDM